MIKRIGIVLAALGAVLMTAGPTVAHTPGDPAFVSRYEYRHVHPGELEHSVERSWDYSGTHIMAWTADGVRYRMSLYPSSNAPGYALATYVRHPSYVQAPRFVWLLSSTRWCLPDGGCTAKLPNMPPLEW